MIHFKKKIRQHVPMNYANLAKAIQVKAKLVPCFSMKHNYSAKFHDYIISEVPINNDITIVIEDFCVEEYECSYITFPHQIMTTATYIGDIKVNEYTFLYKSNKWELLNKEIYHPIPDDIIRLINNWSLSCIKSYKENQERKNSLKKISAQQIYSKEENILKSIFNKYKKKDSINKEKEKNDSISFEELKKLEGNPVWLKKRAVWCLVQQVYEDNGKKEVLIVFLEKDNDGLLDTNNIWVNFEEDSFYRFQKND